MYSLKEAATAVGIGKPALLKAIQKGRISASKNDFGEWKIDPAELHRVYRPVPRETFEEPRETVPGSIELKAKFDAMAEVKARLENECADLRRRLDQSEDARQKAEEAKTKAFAELTRLTLMLTDQRTQQEPPGPQPKRGFWQKLWGK
jgi:hypothetical protein